MKKTLLFLLFTASLSVRAQGSLNSGLLGRFSFDNTLADATGNMSNVNATNTAFGLDARNQANAALRLVSTGEVAIQPAGLLDFSTTGSFSFSVAFRTLSSATQAFFSNQGTYTVANTTSSRGWSLGFASAQAGKLYLNLVRDNSANSGLGLATQASFNDGQWHTATVVVDRTSSQVRLYVDGTAQALTYVSPNPVYGSVSGTTFTLSATGSPFVDLSPGYSLSQTNTLTTGNRFGLNYNGWLDEARFYNRVLTAAEVQTLSAQVLATLSAQAAAAQVQVFPSPALPKQGITVQLAQAVAASQLQVLDILGRAVAVRITPMAAGGRAYELSGLRAGSYLLHVSLPEGTAVRRLQVD
jgi:hypothetical protein